MEEPQDCLLELRYRGRRGDDATAEPKSDAQTEAPAVGNRHKLFDLVHESPATFSVAMQGVMDLLDIAPYKRELGLDRVRPRAIIDRPHAQIHEPSPPGRSTRERVLYGFGW